MAKYGDRKMRIRKMGVDDREIRGNFNEFQKRDRQQSPLSVEAASCRSSPFCGSYVARARRLHRYYT
jgi:hypothetical protein